MRWLANLILGTALVFPTVALATQPCGHQPGWHFATVAGSVAHPNTYRHVDEAWTFILDPTDHGWRIEMSDAAGADIPVHAPPDRPVETNPVNIAGWHFRNAANTGPNTGDVNAPQHQRRFAFGAMVPNGNAVGMGGLGDLVIEGFQLSPSGEGRKAVMQSLDFSACIASKPGTSRLNPLVSSDPGVAYETIVSTMLGCGFDDQTYLLSDRMAQGREGGQHPFLEPDLDGDNIPDLVVPTTRRADDAPGLAICLLGDETLLLAGYSGRIGRHLDPVYFARADFWDVHRGPVSQGAAEGPPPTLRGDAILLAKEEASSVLLFVTSSREISSYWQGD